MPLIKCKANEVYANKYPSHSYWIPIPTEIQFDYRTEKEKVMDDYINAVIGFDTKRVYPPTINKILTLDYEVDKVGEPPYSVIQTPIIELALTFKANQYTMCNRDVVMCKFEVDSNMWYCKPSYQEEIVREMEYKVFGG